MPADLHVINTIIMAELLTAEHLFAHFLEKRTHYFLRFLITCIICLSAAYFFPLLPFSMVLTGSLMYLTIFLVSGIGIFLCYQEDFWSIFFCCVTGYTIQHLASLLNSVFGVLLPGLPPVIIYFFTLIVPYAICYQIFSRDIRRLKRIMIDNKRLLLLSAVGIFIDAISGLFVMALGIKNPQPQYETLLNLSNVLVCVLLLCVQFGLLSNRNLELELSVVSQMLQEKEKQYQASRDNIDIINQKCHDLKHQIRSLRKDHAVIDGTALKEIENAVNIYDTTVKTGNAALDVILTEKSLLCEKNGITLTCMADGNAIGFMTPGDVYSLFGNAVDNAIEAVSKVSNPEKRSIGLFVREKGMMTSIHIENSFEGTLRFQDGLPQTSKEDRAYHGFGMKSMRTIAEKYGGFLTASTRNGVFNLDIVIPKSQ